MAKTLSGGRPTTPVPARRGGDGQVGKVAEGHCWWMLGGQKASARSHRADMRPASPYPQGQAPAQNDAPPCLAPSLGVDTGGNHAIWATL